MCCNKSTDMAAFNVSFSNRFIETNTIQWQLLTPYGNSSNKNIEILRARRKRSGSTLSSPDTVQYISRVSRNPIFKLMELPTLQTFKPDQDQYYCKDLTDFKYISVKFLYIALYVCRFSRFLLTSSCFNTRLQHSWRDLLKRAALLTSKLLPSAEGKINYFQN